MAGDCQWCFFKDKNNDFCVIGDLNWKVQAKTERYNQEDQVLTIPGFYRHTFKFESIQSSSWMTRFNLKKLVYNTMQYIMAEYTIGLKFEIYYWYADQALCVSSGLFITPADFTLVSTSKLEQCSRVVIKCIDSWSSWTDENELLFGTCSLSSSEDFTIYQFKPIETEFTHYIIGSEKYQANYCFPGPTPMYSPFDTYPNNFLYADWLSQNEIAYAFRTALAGLPSFNPAFDVPVERQNSWSKIYENLSTVLTQDMPKWMGIDE